MNTNESPPSTASLADTIVSVGDHVYHVLDLGQQPLSVMLNATRDGAVAAEIAVIRAIQTDTADTHETQANLDAHLAYVESLPKKPEEQAAFFKARAAYYVDRHDKDVREDIISWLKKALPGVQFSCRGPRRGAKHMLEHTRLICIDTDDLPDVAATVAEVGADPHCVTTFPSPTGTGAKFLFRVPKTDAQGHKERTFPTVAAYLMEEYGVRADPSGSDVARLCYLSHYPDITINVDATEFVIPDEMPVPVTIAAPGTNTGGVLTPGEDFNVRGGSELAAVLRRNDWTSSDDTNWTRPGKNGGTSATLGNVEGPPNSFWVFSDAAPPFIPNKRYEAWHVFALLECNGDYSLATSELQKRGYGTAGADTFLILPSNCGLTISESAEKIYGAIAPTRTLFTRGRIAHEVVIGKTGTPQLEPITAKAFRSRLEKYGRPMTWRADQEHRRKLVPCICPEDAAAALLATTEARDLLPNIRAIITSPTLSFRGDNELVMLQHGWNPENGGVFVTGHEVPETVPLAEAVPALVGLLDDFDFQSGGDRSRALAAIITPALKAGGLLTCSTPIEVCEADQSQAGKGYLRKLVSAVYAETPTLIAQRVGGVGSFDEEIASALIAGRLHLQFDNLRGKIASTYLEAILTAEGPVTCRVPHKPTVEIDVTPYTWAATSNGMDTTRDLANRCSIVRIKKRPADYTFRVYPEDGLLEHVKARQRYYLGCIFAIVGEWFMEGCQRTTENRHDFRTWARSLDWIVTNVLGGAPLMEGHSDARDRVSDQGKTWLRAVAIAIAADGKLDQELTASELAELSSVNDIPIPSRKPDAEDSDSAPAIGRAMKKIFSAGNDVQIDGFTVTRRPYATADGKDGKRYHFAQTT